MDFLIKFFKPVLFFGVLLFLLAPVFVLVQNSDEIFKAEVIEILQEKEIIGENNLKTFQQNIKLKGLEGEWQGKQIIF